MKSRRIANSGVCPNVVAAGLREGVVSRAWSVEVVGIAVISGGDGESSWWLRWFGMEKMGTVW